MNPNPPRLTDLVRWCLPLLLAAPLGAFALPVIAFSDFPLFLAPATKPNVMIIFDNSQSMDATMSGMVINGDDVTTRGNVARGVLRNVLATYRGAFNWGLSEFETNGGPSRFTTYAYYLGNAVTMVYTNDCVAGISVSNAARRCRPNPDSTNANGFSFITYDRTGDDAEINDVLYFNDVGPQIYAVGDTNTFDSYTGYQTRDKTSGWLDANFNSVVLAGPFGATDAGFTPVVAVNPRQFFLRRGWGYYNNITGRGRIRENSLADSDAHFNRLIDLLHSEVDNNGSTEIKNNAVFTPLAGSLQTVKQYFDNTTRQTPISQTCQRNFVMMATDGNPTGRTDGSLYTTAQRTNVDNPLGSNTNWTYGTAQQDVFSQLTALRSTVYGGKTYDVQTYVIGMGNSVANPSSVAALNRMASLGGGAPAAFLGNDVDKLTTAFQAIVGDIQAKTSAASSVALNSGSYNAGSAIYQAKFNSGDWSGNLLAFPILDTGELGAVATWEAATQVKNQNWDTQRNILTYKPSVALGARGIPFRWPVTPASPTATELDVSQSTALNLNAAAVNDGNGLARQRYLRGDASLETRNCINCALQFRNRNATPLGDIVNSSPYYVGAPNFGYYDDMEAVAYSSFVTTYRARAKVIYAGANDGMLHAINAATGNEMFAYVPSSVYSGLSKLTDSNYTHRYSVDGSPTVGDVFYNGGWHSLLVSGMRTGAKGLFALDVTNPANFSEAGAAGIARWEFTDPDMGYVFGQPLIVKTNNGRWSVVVSGGYNAASPSVHAFLFIIDAETGALVRKIDTGSGVAGSPNGLSAAAAIDTNGDGVADLVYAGDLDGHLWKFDLTAAAPASWVIGNAGLPLFTATGQSVTGRPDITRFPGGGYLVVFGTGRYLASADNTDLTAQTEYAVRDKNIGATVTLAQLQQQVIQQVVLGGNGKSYRLTTHAVGPASDAAVVGDNAITRANYVATKMGWYMNLPTSGERSVGNTRFRGGRVIFTSIIPNVSDPCEYGGNSWLMELDAITGNRFDTPTFDTNGDNNISPADLIGGVNAGGQGGVGVAAGGAGSGIWSDASISGNRNGTTTLEDKYSNTSDGTVQRIRETAGKAGEGRVMWREVR